jgi:hypothetical protein
MKLAPSRTVKISAGLVAVAVLVLVVGNFVLVKPLKAEAADARDETAQLEQERSSLQAQFKALQGQQNAVPEFYRLSKAASVNVDVPGINLELLTLADTAGVDIRAFQTSDVDERDGFAAPTFSVTLHGQMTEVQAYLKSLRELVTVRSNRLRARGNLYRVDDFDIKPLDTTGGAAESVPTLEAVLTLSVTAPASVAAEASGAAVSPEGGEAAADGNGDAPEGDAAPQEGADG